MGSSLKCGLRQLISNRWQLAAGMFPFIIWLFCSVGILITDVVSIFIHLYSNQRDNCRALGEDRRASSAPEDHTEIQRRTPPYRQARSSPWDVQSGEGWTQHWNRYLAIFIRNNATTFCEGEGPPEGNEGGLQGGPSQDTAQDHWLHRLQGSCSGQVRS